MIFAYGTVFIVSFIRAKYVTVGVLHQQPFGLLQTHHKIKTKEEKIKMKNIQNNNKNYKEITHDKNSI
jgi:hypothetical protein